MLHLSLRAPVALATEEELDDYTWRVAGCVGDFWTRICRAHLFPNASIEELRLIEDGIRFGKGLQLVNILRDIAVDLRRGRCYLPAPRLREQGLSPEDAVRYAFKSVGLALVITTVVLAAGFLVLSLSPFKVNADMGLMTAITIVIALLVDFLFLPPLLMKLERKHKIESELKEQPA